jgi:hypothetical protein
VNRRTLAPDVALALWIVAGSVVYLRQFAGPGLGLLARLLGLR